MTYLLTRHGSQKIVEFLHCWYASSSSVLLVVSYLNSLSWYTGGGPTGVEFAAELHDLLHAELAAHYPILAKMAKITMYDVAPSILGSFDERLVK